MHYQVSFGAPWYLLLLALLPPLWWFSLRSLALLGPVRKWIVVALRTAVLTAIVLALAEIQMVRLSDRLTVIYLLDQSASIPVQQRRAMVEYVNQAVREHRRGRDRVGVIVFGRDAAIEVPPFDDDVQIPTVESELDPEYTNLAGALKLAKATFPEDSAKRIVLVSDGNENLGDVLEQAQGIAGAGIGIDVVPVRYQARAEVVVERLALPADVRRGEPFDLRLVVTNTAGADQAGAKPVAGRLVLSRLTESGPEVMNPNPEDQAVVLPPGKKVFTFREQIDRPNFYKYEARFIPDDPDDDAMPQNNRATAFTHVRGKGLVLLIEDYEHPGEFAVLVERLRLQDLEVHVRPSDQVQIRELADLLPYDSVILADVPRATNDRVSFTDAQIAMLVRNTQQMGSGLVMLGGPNSFGAGGWTGTELERAMPVDFQIKSAKVVPRGALVMIMHACEIPEGNFWQKKITHEAIKTLGGQDYCGVLHWNGTDQWMWGGGLLPVAGNRQQMMARVDRMTPGDMPQFDPAMRMAVTGLRRVPGAAVKHVIIISDGDPSAPTAGTIQGFKNINATISTVAVGAHGPAESSLLKRIATQCGGKYYAVKSPKALPRIFQREARRVARPLVWDKHPVRPQIEYPHQMVSGLESPLPPIRGFVLTTKKDNPLVEIALVSPEPAGKVNSTILAGWTYGLGRAVAFTSDCGARWLREWDQATFDRLFGQIVRWSMRPTGDTGKFTVATELRDERVEVVVTALDKDDEFLNFLAMNGNAVGPNLKPFPFELQQTAPGRYVGSFPARDAGSYFIVVDTGATKELDGTVAKLPPILTGVNVPYSDEFRDQAANEALLGELARLVPKGKGGKRGVLIEPKEGRGDEGLLGVDTFRHGGLAQATSSQDIWYYVLLLGSCLFFFDVFFRRVQVSLAWVPPLLGAVRDTILRRERAPAKAETMDRLRSRKAEVSGQIQQLRSDARFEPTTPGPIDSDVLDRPAERPAPPPAAGPTISGEEEKKEESYTERLLRAKRKAWKDKDPPPPGG